MAVDRHIEVNAMAVRRALARSFNGLEPDGHAWRGRAGAGDVVVTVDVLGDVRSPYVRLAADVLETGPLDGHTARVLVDENAELVLGRLVHLEDRVFVEHAILAGTTMAAVEVQSSTWAVGWAASAFRRRLRALLTEAVPCPPPPQLPAALRRDAQDHLEITGRRVRRFLEERHGGFQHDPDWGYHGGFGSARVFVDVLPVLESSTAVRASSPVLSQVDMTDELAVRLHELTTRSPFGSFQHLPSRREVWFQHAILGDDLDQNELDAAIEIVARTADDHDDELAGAFGGLRYADLG